MMGWIKSELGAVASISAGNSAPQDPRLFVNGKFQFFRTSDIGRIRTGDIAAAADNLNEDGIVGLRRFPKGTILLPKSGASTFLNHRVIMAVDGYVSSHLATIVANPAYVDSRFLLHYLTTIRAQDMVQDHAYPSLNLSLIAGIEVPLPTIREQQRIVAILDEAFECITTAKENAEKNLQNAREVFEGKLGEVFSFRQSSWPERCLGELGTITSSKRIFANEYTDRGVKFFRTKEIKQLANGDEITTELYISNERFSALRSKFGVPKTGDLLLTAIGTIGEVYVVEDIGDFYFKDGNVLWLKDFSSVNSYFLKYALKSFVEGLNRLARGSAYSALPINKLNAHRIVIPPEVEQRAVVEKLDELDEACRQLEENYVRKIENLSNLKESLLHQAFTGQL